MSSHHQTARPSIAAVLIGAVVFSTLAICGVAADASAAAGITDCSSRPSLTCFLTATQSLDASGQPSMVSGKLDFTPVSTPTNECTTAINGTITGLRNASLHGIHVHQKGDISDPRGLAAGEHYNPFSALHGIPGIDRLTHEGDLGNLKPDANGNVVVSISSMINTRLILGRGLIVHALQDQGSSFQPTGNSGARIAQCVLGRTDFTNVI